MENILKESLDQLPEVKDKAISFDVMIKPNGKLHAWLQKIKIMPVKKSFTMHPLVLFNLQRVSRMILKIDPDATTKGFVDTSHHLIQDHVDTVLQIISIAIKNTTANPSRRLVKLLKNNLNNEEVMKLLAYVMIQMDLKSFVLSINLMRGLNVLDGKEN